MAEEPWDGPGDEAARERELVRRCLAGDEQAQRELVRRAAPLAWSLCRRRAGVPPAEAEDVSQEVFWGAFVALPRYRGECRLSTWLSTLALRRIVDYRRSPARRQVPVGAPASPGFPAPAEPSRSSPEAQALDAERQDRLRSALDGLAEPARTVVVAYYLGEVPVAEIARLLAMPEGTVKTHLHCRRQALRDVLRDLC